MRDPEPMTPRTSKVPEIDVHGVLLAHSAQIERLAHALTSLDAEIGRLTETVNRQDGTISDLRESLSIVHGELARASLESPAPTDPDAVALPRSLVEALDVYVGYHTGQTTEYSPTAWRTFVQAYDAWKAGQG
jgi:hypothetical protein